ncbi:secreted protein [gut metagenome]|uniref:Secreted protein n=1 Tax=gut metagenome TaxID=749906 RepID=J9G595_9ZZZZ
MSLRIVGVAISIFGTFPFVVNGNLLQQFAHSTIVASITCSTRLIITAGTHHSTKTQGFHFFDF